MLKATVLTVVVAVVLAQGFPPCPPGSFWDQRTRACVPSSSNDNTRDFRGPFQGPGQGQNRGHLGLSNPQPTSSKTPGQLTSIIPSQVSQEPTLAGHNPTATMEAQTTEEVAMITLTTVTTAATGMTTMAATGMATIAATGMTTMAMTTGMVTMTTVIAPIDATSTSIGTERIVPPITIPTPV